MRLMSFALTTEQIRDRSKTVTRRIGWQDLKPGTLLCAVRKAQGLKKGEKVERLATIRVVNVRRESLRRMLDDDAYGRDECRREGFLHEPFSLPFKFVHWFAATHGCEISDEVTRIEFECVNPFTPSVTPKGS